MSPASRLAQQVRVHLRRVMPAVLLAGGVAAVPLVTRPAHTQDPAAADSLVAIIGVTVVDVTGGPSRADHTVLIRGGRIASVAPAAATVVPDDALVVDGRGRFLIPGLWDAHMHAFHRPSFNGVLLAHGITAVRDMGGVVRPLVRWRDDVRAGAFVGPRLVFSGGILDAFVAAPQRSFFIQVDDSARAVAVVDSLAALGSDFIKTYTALDTATFRVVVAAARAHGLAVDGHLPLGYTPAAAARAGLRTQEHLYGFLHAASPLGASLTDSLYAHARTTTDPYAVFPVMRSQFARLVATYDSTRAAQEHARLAAVAAVIVPTLVVLESPSRLRDSAFVHDAALRAIPAVMRPAFASAAAARERAAETDAAFEARLFDRHLGTVRSLHRAGVTLLAGSDAPNPFTAPGDALHRELALLVRAGLSPLAALQAATINPARAFGLSDSLGTIDAGRLADLVLLDADPLTDIRNTRRIHAVVVNGRVLRTDALARLRDDALRVADAFTSWGSPPPTRD